MALQGAGGERVPVPSGPAEPDAIAALRQQILETRQEHAQTMAQFEVQLKDMIEKAVKAETVVKGQVTEMVAKSVEIETNVNNITSKMNEAIEGKFNKVMLDIGVHIQTSDSSRHRDLQKA